MKVFPSEDYPGMHALELTKREAALRFLPFAGFLGSAKLVAGMVLQGPDFRGIAVNKTELEALAARRPQNFPEITDYLGVVGLSDAVQPELIAGHAVHDGMLHS